WRQDDEAPDRLALELVGNTDRGTLGHGRVVGEGGLDLGGAEPLAGHVHRVVGPAVEEPEPVGVDARPVAVDPDVREPTPVRVEVALRVLPDPARHARPGLLADQLADLADLAGPDGLSLTVPDVDVHAQSRPA